MTEFQQLQLSGPSQVSFIWLIIHGKLEGYKTAKNNNSKTLPEVYREARRMHILWSGQSKMSLLSGRRQENFKKEYDKKIWTEGMPQRKVTRGLKVKISGTTWTPAKVKPCLGRSEYTAMGTNKCMPGWCAKNTFHIEILNQQELDKVDWRTKHGGSWSLIWLGATIWRRKIFAYVSIRSIGWPSQQDSFESPQGSASVRSSNCELKLPPGSRKRDGIARARQISNC